MSRTVEEAAYTSIIGAVTVDIAAVTAERSGAAGAAVVGALIAALTAPAGI